MRHVLKLLVLFAISLGLIACGSASKAPKPKPRKKAVLVEKEVEWTLDWEESFDYLDDTTWGSVTGAEGDAYSTDDAKNTYAKDGILHLSAIKESKEGKAYTSAHINTKFRGDFKYGKFEFKAKLPKGKGLMPSISMLPLDNFYGEGASGKIDIVKADGSQPNTILGGLEYGGTPPNNVSTHASYKLAKGDFSDDFHVFAIEWLPDEIRWYVDGVKYQVQTKDGIFTLNDAGKLEWAKEVKYASSNPELNQYYEGWYTGNCGKKAASAQFAAPFDKKFYIDVSLAVVGADDSTALPADLEIDYMRIYYNTKFEDVGENYDPTTPDKCIETAGPAMSVPTMEVFVNEENERWPQGWWELKAGSLIFKKAKDKNGVMGAAKEIKFNGAAVYFFQGPKEDKFDYIKADAVMKFDMKLLAKPKGKVKFRVDCVHPCAGEVDYTDKLPEVGKWTEITIPLKDFKKGGTNFKTVNTPWLVWNDQDLHMLVANIRWEGGAAPAAGAGAKADIEPLTVFVNEESDRWPQGWWELKAGSLGFKKAKDKNGVMGAAKEVSFNGHAVYFFQGPKEDLFDYIRANASLKFDMKVLSTPEETGQVILRIDCVHPCAGKIDITKDLPPVGEWTEMSFPLKDLKKGGTNFKTVNTPWLIENKNKFKFLVANIRWE